MEKGRGILEEIHDWYQNLGEREKKKHAIFAVHAISNDDYENGVLVDGVGEDIMVSLATAMLDNEDVFQLIEMAYLTVKEEREEKRKKKSTKPKISKVKFS